MSYLGRIEYNTMHLQYSGYTQEVVVSTSRQQTPEETKENAIQVFQSFKNSIAMP